MIGPVSKFLVKTSKRWEPLSAIVFIIFAWLFLWFFPWQEKLHHIYWLQLGIALAIFIIPGLCIYGLLIDRSYFGFSHITFGFAISHTIFAILGALGRFVHLSFETISFLMMVFGLISLLGYVVPKINNGFHLNSESIQYFISILPVLIVALLACVIVSQRVLRDDDLSYLAYLTNLQYSSSLKFNYPILDVSQPAPLRFWLMSAPLAQALLAELSKTPGVLILAGYYDPFLVVISVLCWYELAIALNLSPKKAGASTILQLLFLLLLSEYLHPGAPFFLQLNNDKATAAFILTPIFLQSLIILLKNPVWNHRLAALALITGLSLTFMHPIILAYSVFIGGVLILLKNNCQGMQKKVMPMAILVIILIPYLVIRFSDFSTTDPVSFDAEVVLNKDGSDNLITRLGDTNFYGFNLNILSMKFPYKEVIPLPKSILKWGWLLIPALSAIFAIQKREKIIAQFILSSFLLCFLAGFPLTGWLIGYFLNGRMLARSVWLFPYGISTVYVFTAIGDYVKGKISFQKYKITNIFISPNWLLFIVTVLTIIFFSLYLNENDLLETNTFSAKSQRYQGLAVAGQELDRRISDYAYVIGSEQLNDLIPGISAKSKPITFRILNFGHMPYFSRTQIEERISDSKKIFSNSLSPEDKMYLLKKYDIRFLFLQKFDLRLFEDFIERYSKRVEIVEIGGVVILQIDPQIETENLD